MTSPGEASTYFRKGFGLKSEVQGDLAADYDGNIVDLLRSQDFRLTVGDVTIRLAKEFGFCYGVERAVDYAYQTRRKFPERRVFLVGEIIHNPHVNERLRTMGVEILVRPEPTGDARRGCLTHHSGREPMSNASLRTNDAPGIARSAHGESSASASGFVASRCDVSTAR